MIRFSFFAIILLIGCQKDDSFKTKIIDGYVVGFDPCNINMHYKDTAFVIISLDVKDTIVTYNLPNIFNIPSYYFDDYINTAYFPTKARNEFKVRATYRKAKEDEIPLIWCTADINTSDFANPIICNQIIILSPIKE